MEKVFEEGGGMERRRLDGGLWKRFWRGGYDYLKVSFRSGNKNL